MKLYWAAYTYIAVIDGTAPSTFITRFRSYASRCQAHLGDDPTKRLRHEVDLPV